jgi:hypothetical protein
MCKSSRSCCVSSATTWKPIELAHRIDRVLATRTHYAGVAELTYHATATTLTAIGDRHGRRYLAQAQDEQTGYDWVEAQLWPNGPECPRCGGLDRITKLQGKSARIGIFPCGSGCRRLLYSIQVKRPSAPISLTA